MNGPSTFTTRQAPIITLPPSPPHSASPQHTPQTSPKLRQSSTNAFMPATPERTPSVGGSGTSDGDSPGPTESMVGAVQRDTTSSKVYAGRASRSSKGREHRVGPVVEQETKPLSRKMPVLEDFQLIRVIGKGVAGRVLLVKETANNQIHAMKAVSKRSVLAHNELHHTLAELRILKQFAEYEPDNRFVTRLNCAFMDRENFYFVMKFYPGGDLATQMEIYGCLGDVRTRFYTVDIVEGLEHLHRNGIIVRDLKPENVLLDRRGHAVLADFGLAKSCGYRGPTHPMRVVAYPGQPELPEWAGAGAGSLRTFDGVEKVVVDRTFSFVGTVEYLSPEMIYGSGHSYAVDFWALGCIVVEALIGRVPFRKTDDEPHTDLWNRIISDQWYAILEDPIMKGRSPEDFGINEETWDFIDALMQKDPMWRLTEPYIKLHPYFNNIDWEFVRRQGYNDPHGLYIDPIPEYNTNYFPRLCLEETPTVDMQGHDERDEILLNKSKKTVADSAGNLQQVAKSTPLNDNQAYQWELARWKLELKEFEYVWPGYQHERGEGEREGEGNDVEVEDDGEASEGQEGDVGEVQADDTLARAEDHDNPSLTDYEALLKGAEDRDNSDQSAPPPALAVSSVDSHHTLDHTAADILQRFPKPALSHTATCSHIPDLHVGRPPLSPTASLSAMRPSASEPVRIAATAGNSTTSPSRRAKTLQSPLQPQHQLLQLPSGLPASGLSVSDIVSVPTPLLPNLPLTGQTEDRPISNPDSSFDTHGQSPHQQGGQNHASEAKNAPNILLRRHQPRPSVDSIPVSRLSIEVRGEMGETTSSQLGDEDWDSDWEKLDVKDLAGGVGSIPSLANVGPQSHGAGAFFTKGIGMSRGKRTKGLGSKLRMKRSGSSAMMLFPRTSSSGLTKAARSSTTVNHDGGMSSVSNSETNLAGSISPPSSDLSSASAAGSRSVSASVSATTNQSRQGSPTKNRMMVSARDGIDEATVRIKGKFAALRKRNESKDGLSGIITPFPFPRMNSPSQGEQQAGMSGSRDGQAARYAGQLGPSGALPGPRGVSRAEGKEDGGGRKKSAGKWFDRKAFFNGGFAGYSKTPSTSRQVSTAQVKLEGQPDCKGDEASEHGMKTPTSPSRAEPGDGPKEEDKATHSTSVSTEDLPISTPNAVVVGTPSISRSVSSTTRSTVSRASSWLAQSGITGGK